VLDRDRDRAVADGAGVAAGPAGRRRGRRATRAELVARGVEASEIQHFPWSLFTFFKDPGGNGWSVQQITNLD
jgi:hypothetical protein